MSAPLRLAIAMVCVCGAQSAAAEVTWNRELYDLGGARLDLPEADLLLPLPCGGAMAFQRVVVSVDLTDPLADRVVRLGQSDTGAGYMDYLSEQHLRGGFTDAESAGSYYYVARYELTELQYAALTVPDCAALPALTVRGTVPKLELSWFEATDLAQRYNEWLRTEAPEALPVEDGVAGFLRLPTETEWEFAARGGEAVDPLDFGALRPPMDGELSQYAQFDQTGPAPVGAKAPNPLLLFDMLGNAEELMLEPFRLNAIGHAHGLPGGIVTRGGSFQSTADDMRSSRRSEWAPFSSTTGLAQAQDTFGMRLVLSVPVMTSDARVDAIRTAWLRRFQGDDVGEAAVLPVEALQQLIAAELDPDRRAALEAILLELSEAQDEAERADRAQIAVTLEMATVLLENIRFQDNRVAAIEDYIGFLDQQIADLTANEIGADPDVVADALTNAKASRAEFESTIAALGNLRRNLLGSYREALDALVLVDLAELDSQFGMLSDKLEARENLMLADVSTLLRDDIEAFRGNPDPDADALLAIARVPPDAP